MRLSATLAVLSACLAPALASSAFDGKSAAAIVDSDDDHKIPGDSPLELCQGKHDEDLVTISNVDLLPNPPKAGKQLVIKASGNIKKKIEKGAYVKLVVKYGLIKLLTTEADLCEQIGNVDLKCPLEPGDTTIEKTVDLPAEIPPGKYNVEADVYTADDEPITCLTATVSFTLGGSGFFSNEL